ncbi:MAG: SDR family NAD(P)-dependent oxidoreductase [Tepidisphaeraceae bacterium]
MFIERFRLDGKVALLTGSGRGIGLGMAKVFAEQGAAVAIQDLDRDVAEAEAKAIRHAGGRAIAIGGDVSDLSVVKTFIPQTVEQLGGLHILVNNAGLQADQHYAEQSDEKVEWQLRANMVAAMRLVQWALPIFKQQHWGRVINVSSIQGRKGNPGNLPYGMSKAALNHMTLSLARELGQAGATINCIAPGWFDTLRNKTQLTPEHRENAKKWIPAGRHGDDFDCAGYALLLASDAGLYITGQTLVIDGGLTA